MISGQLGETGINGYEEDFPRLFCGGRLQAGTCALEPKHLKGTRAMPFRVSGGRKL